MREIIVSAKITSKTILEWRKDGYIRRITPVADIVAMITNSRSDFLDVLVDYIDFVLNQYNYKNYFKDACAFMLNEDGPYRLYLEDIHFYFFPDDEFNVGDLTVGHLIGYMLKQDNFLIEQFTWHFLIALRGLDPREPPFDFSDYFEQTIAEQFVVLINQLREG